MSASQLNTTIEYEQPDTKVKEDEIACKKTESLHFTVIPNANVNSVLAPNPVLKSVATQDAFGEDDSFDDFMSQINEEDVINNAVDNGRSAIAGSMSPVIVSKNKRRKCFELNLVGQNEAALG